MIDPDKLKKGDKIIRDSSSNPYFSFTEGKSYEVLIDDKGLPYVLEDSGTRYGYGRLNSNRKMWRHATRYNSVGKVNMLSVESHLEDSKLVFEVTVLTDKKGKETIENIVEKSKAYVESIKLEEDIANLEASLARLKAKRETIK